MASPQQQNQLSLPARRKKGNRKEGKKEEEREELTLSPKVDVDPVGELYRYVEFDGTV